MIREFAAGSRGGVLVTECWGNADAQAVVLLHGGGQSRRSWQKTCEQLAAAGFYAVAVDMKGHGDSYWDTDAQQNGMWDAKLRSGNSINLYQDEADRRKVLGLSKEAREIELLHRFEHDHGLSMQHPYNFTRFAEDLDRLVNMAGLISPVLVGASLGGLATLCSEVARTTACAVVLVDVTPKLEMKGVTRITSFMSSTASKGFESIEEAALEIAKYNPKRSKGDSSLAGVKSLLRQRKSDGRWTWRWDPNFLGPMPTEEGLLYTECFIMQQARHVRCPVLLVRGQQTDVVSMDGVQQLLDAVPQAKFVDVREAGHMVAGDVNDVFAEEVVRFLRGIEIERSRL